MRLILAGRLSPHASPADRGEQVMEIASHRPVILHRIVVISILFKPRGNIRLVVLLVPADVIDSDHHLLVFVEFLAILVNQHRITAVRHCQARLSEVFGNHRLHLSLILAVLLCEPHYLLVDLLFHREPETAIGQNTRDTPAEQHLSLFEPESLKIRGNRIKDNVAGVYHPRPLIHRVLDHTPEGELVGLLAPNDPECDLVIHHRLQLLGLHNLRGHTRSHLLVRIKQTVLKFLPHDMVTRQVLVILPRAVIQTPVETHRESRAVRKPDSQSLLGGSPGDHRSHPYIAPLDRQRGALPLERTERLLTRRAPVVTIQPAEVGIAQAVDIVKILPSILQRHVKILGKRPDSLLGKRGHRLADKQHRQGVKPPAVKVPPGVILVLGEQQQYRNRLYQLTQSLMARRVDKLALIVDENPEHQYEPI